MSKGPGWRYPLSDIVVGPEEEEAVLRVVRSRWLSMGPEVEALEQELAAATGSKHVLATTNCTAALHLALLALGIGPGDEVILPSLSFVATANAVLFVGATPVFADIESVSRPLTSVDETQARISSRTKAILVMHYGGYSCDMKAITELAAAKGLAVVEDSAHAAFSSHAGKICGTWGDAGCFSFFGNKNLPCGEGGAIAFQDSALADKARKFRSHGMTTLSWQRNQGHASAYDVVGLGYNYRMPELSAAFARTQLRRLMHSNAVRDRLFKRYCERLSGAPGVEIPFREQPDPGSRHLMAVLVESGPKRDHLIRALGAEGIQASVHYKPIHHFSHYRQLAGQPPLVLRKTESYSERVLTLPFHAGLGEQDVDAITEILLRLNGGTA